MDYRVVNGKKANSKIIFVVVENQLYLKKTIRSDVLCYVTCYFKSCSVSGKIQNEKFSHTNDGIHCNHTQSVSSLMEEWKFYEALRLGSRKFSA